MMSEPADVTGYAKAADAYWNVGWRGVLPLKAGYKTPPPSVKCAAAKAKDPNHPLNCPHCVSYTGHAGIDPSFADLVAWSEEYQNGNLCLRLPDGIIGIDVDAYGAKTGDQTLIEAETRWGRLPPTARSTSRDDGVSGIRLYRVPVGTVLEQRISFPELAIGDIEIVQRHHRYVVCWPSIHPEGREYRWRNNDDQLIDIPEPDNLPWLPQEWINELRITPRSPILNGASFDIQRALTAAEPSQKVQDRLNQAIKELNLPGQSRHDTTCPHVLALLRLGKDGEPGVKAALGLLREVFVAATSVDKSRTPDEARDEFDRMITNPNAARELAQPGLLDWMRTVAAEPAPAPLSRDQAPRSRLEEIEQGFWDSRDSLNTIYTAALARLCSPWAVLAFCVARVLAQVRPNWVLPALIGGSGGSLNWFAAIADQSSGGKTTAMSLARHLIGGDVRERNLGSGEGIIGSFFKPATRKGEVDEFHESNMFIADEIDTVAALGARSGQTTMSVLRSAFSGETLGFSYIAKGRDVHLKAHTYRMTLVVSVQPGRAGALLDHYAGGTPQRFMWFPANDRRISREHQSIWIPGPLTVPHQDTYPREIIMPDEAVDTIVEERVRNAHGEVGPMDGHALFSREKLCFALTLMDGRIDVNSEDWRLSGIAAEVSAHTRDWVASQLEEAVDDEAELRGRSLGVASAASEAARTAHSAKRVRAVSDWVLGKLKEEPRTNGDLHRTLSGERRKWLPSALFRLQQDGLILQDEQGRWTLT